MSEIVKWWTDPRGIASALTIFGIIMGFWIVRERQLWEHGARIVSLEARGDVAIKDVYVRLQRLEDTITLLKDRVTAMEFRAMQEKRAE